MRNVKGIVAGMLVSILMIGGMPEWTIGAEPTVGTLAPDEKVYYIGDVDGNGKVEILDVREILGCVLHLNTGYTYEVHRNKRRDFIGDMNTDGNLTWEDAMLILKTAMQIDGVSEAEFISTERNQSYEIIYEAENMTDADDVFTVDSEEALEEYQEYLCGGNEEYQKELMDRYKGIFDRYNLLVVKAAVYSADVEDITTSVVRNGKRVLAEVKSSYLPQEAIQYQYTNFLCVDKDINRENSILEIECDGISGRADVLVMDYANDFGMDTSKNTVGFTEATSYGHLIRNIEEAAGYRKFLNERFDVRQLANDAYYSKLTPSFFDNHAYAVFTYKNRYSSTQYRVLGMDYADGVLHVKLQWYDLSQGAPGFVAGTYGVFVSVPADMAAQVSKVELEVVPENGIQYKSMEK